MKSKPAKNSSAGGPSVAKRVWLTVVQFRIDDRWRGGAVIDGRDYPDEQSYDQAVSEAFGRVNGMDVPAQFASRNVWPDEPPSPLPTCASYLAALTLLAEYHNDALPEEFPRYTAEAFAAYKVTPYEEWLFFTVESGFSNQSFLVSDPMVYESPGWQSYEDALTEARTLKAAGATRRP